MKWWVGGAAMLVAAQSFACAHHLLEAALLRSLAPGNESVLAGKIESGQKLNRNDRLQLVFLRLQLSPMKPRSAPEALAQIAEVMRAVEKDYLPAAPVDAAYRAYRYWDPDDAYVDDPRHTEILKPPALRYRWKNAPLGRMVITQLEHVTVLYENGSVEIYRIDPAVRTRLSNPADPSVVAILGDDRYFQNLSQRPDLCIFRR